ncbi:hypothetical protein QJS04_geneDACA006696 [Acorus gramineus]|uniref:Uncharacterized protein n=1 Tax=Acorus gramineus TaxID=55184 RepID=A0AAV9AZR2_ACOGR|nr:hypothetical protein QJS04_geneDACA006696 [Acorus gramineus]
MIGQPTNQNPQRGTLTTTRSGGHALWPTGTIFLGLGGEEGTAQSGQRSAVHVSVTDGSDPIRRLRRTVLMGPVNRRP